MRDFLIKDAGFDYVVTLTNGAATEQRITRLMEEEFPSFVGPNDRFLFYFSGHGTQRPVGTNKRGYLVLQTAARADAYSEMIAMSDIQRWADNLDGSRQSLFLLDACFSGLAGRQHKGVLDRKTIDRLSQRGHFLITAGTEGQRSYVVRGRSLFTQAFIDGARGAADAGNASYPQDNVVSLRELTEYIQKRIQDDNLNMSPQLADVQLSGGDSTGEFFFLSREFLNVSVGNPADSPLHDGVPVAKGGTSESRIDMAPPSERSVLPLDQGGPSVPPESSPFGLDKLCDYSLEQSDNVRLIVHNANTGALTEAPLARISSLSNRAVVIRSSIGGDEVGTLKENTYVRVICSSNGGRFAVVAADRGDVDGVVEARAVRLVEHRTDRQP